MMLKMLFAMSLLATFAVPAVADDVGAKRTPSPRVLSIGPMGACSCCRPGSGWEKPWVFLDTETDLPITHALGWGLLEEGGRWECQKVKRLHFDWSDQSEEGFNGFVIAG